MGTTIDFPVFEEDWGRNVVRKGVRYEDGEAGAEQTQSLLAIEARLFWGG